MCQSTFYFCGCKLQEPHTAHECVCGTKWPDQEADSMRVARRQQARYIETLRNSQAIKRERDR